MSLTAPSLFSHPGSRTLVLALPTSSGSCTPVLALRFSRFPLTEIYDAVSSNVSDDDSDEDVLLPPNARRPPGRPQKRRIRGTLEESRYGKAPRRQNKCSRCGGLGHSKRTCVEAI